MLIPGLTFAEKEGLVVNFEGHIQQLSPALDRLWDRVPPWEVVARLVAELTGESGLDTIAGLRRRLAAEEPAFSGVDLNAVGPTGARVGKTRRLIPARCGEKAKAIWPIYLIALGKAVFIWALALTCILVLIWFERKGAAFIQDRVGPNRAAILGVRLAGFIHNFSDVVKLLTKEMMVPAHANRRYFMFAPFVGITLILFAFAVIPWADNLRFGSWDIPMQVSRSERGDPLHPRHHVARSVRNDARRVVVEQQVLAPGGLRSSAQMISYEVPLALSLVGVFMVFGTVQLGEIVRGQGDLLFGFLPKWGVFVQPLGFILFITAAFAETNRTPFDIPEGESEIVAGFHTEYSGIRFALFYMGEYVAIVLASAMVTTLFFGGWQVPYFPTERLTANAGTVLRVMIGDGRDPLARVDGSFRRVRQAAQGKMAEGRPAEPGGEDPHGSRRRGARRPRGGARLLPVDYAPRVGKRDGGARRADRRVRYEARCSSAGCSSGSGGRCRGSATTS